MSPGQWVSTIAIAYLAAPAHSVEEELLRKALGLACDRAGINGAELLERLISQGSVSEVVFDGGDAN